MFTYILYNYTPRFYRQMPGLLVFLHVPLTSSVRRCGIIGNSVLALLHTLRESQQRLEMQLSDLIGPGVRLQDILALVPGLPFKG